MFRSCLRQLIAFLVLPNLLYWVLRSYALEISGHGLIDISYLIVGAAALYWRKWIVLPLLTLVVVADLCDTVAAAFHLRNTGLASVARFVLFPSRSYILLSSALLIGWIAAVVSLIWVMRVYKHRPERRMVALVCLAVAAGLMLANSLSGYGLVVNHHWTARNFRVIPALVRLPSYEIAHDFYVQPSTGHAVGTPIASASEVAIPVVEGAWRQGIKPNVVLILVESWGLGQEPSLNNALFSPYSDPALTQRYKVMRGSTEFLGMTLDGETRELCHNDLGADVMTASSEQLKHCIPHLFQANGYRTNAVHGFYREMFARGTWYPKAGIDQLWLRRTLSKEGLQVCNFGGFDGTCDYEIAGWIGRRVLAGATQPQFIHWVTLNSHLPPPPSLDMAEFGASCDVSTITRESRFACSWYRIVLRTHKAVRDLALQPNIGDTVFIVVGDHMPPFDNHALRQAFSDDEVPYVILVPRTIAPIRLPPVEMAKGAASEHVVPTTAKQQVKTALTPLQVAIARAAARAPSKTPDHK